MSLKPFSSHLHIIGKGRNEGSRELVKLLVFRYGISGENLIAHANALVKALNLPATNLLNLIRDLQIKLPVKKKGHYHRTLNK